MQKVKENRGLSFFLVGLVYLLAAVLGILLYRALNFEMALSLLIADAAATVFVFMFSLIFKNASVYDPYWSVQPIVILLAFAWGKPLGAAQILLLIAVCLWGLRLTANWAYTFHGLLHQDWRYTMLKEKTGVFYPVINFVGIHMVPTLVVYACILPGVYVLRYPLALNTGAVLSVALCVAAVILQGSADVQMHRFRKQKCGGFIRVGLWKHSRHPNYLGEILMWWGVGMFSQFLMPGRWILLAGALANTCLFLFVSIPMADGRQGKKAGFAEYRRATRRLLPLPRLRCAEKH